MKKILLGCILTLATTSAGLAATKNGFYVGLGIAGLTGHHKANLTYVETGFPTETNNFEFSRFSPGTDFMIGYMALIQNFMVGAEIDYLFGNINKTNTFVTSPTASRTIKVDSTGGAWGAAVRLGFNCLDRIMPYIRLGIENRRFKLSHTSQTDVLAPATNTEISSGANKTAFTPGVGMDFKLNQNFILGLEYRYAMYGSITKSGVNTTLPNTTTFKLSPRVSTALVSLKWVWGL